MSSRFQLHGRMIPRTVKRMFDERSEERMETESTTAVLSLRGRNHIVGLVNLSRQGAMVRFAGKTDHRPRSGEVGEANDMIVAAERHDRGLGLGFQPFLGTLVEHAPYRARDHFAVKLEPRAHRLSPPIVCKAYASQLFKDWLALR